MEALDGMARSRKKLGQILVGWGVLNAAQAEKATEEARKAGKRIGQAVVDLGLATEEQVAKALAEQFGLQFVDLTKGGAAEQVDRKALDESMIKSTWSCRWARPVGRCGF
jgi:GSPII_E N-terminal domain.